MLLKIDEIFLSNYKLAYENNLVTVIALKQGIKDHSENNEAKKILLTKIFSEYSQALERLGIFLYSILNRKTKSIFEVYIDENIKKKDTKIYKYIERNSKISLDNLLKLPSPSSLTNTVFKNDYKTKQGLNDSMDRIRDELVKIANIYRARMDKYAVKKFDYSELRDSDAIIFISGYTDENHYNETGKKADILVDAYNRIKHGYNVWRDADSFNKLNRNLADEGIKYVASATIEEKDIQVYLDHLELIKTVEESLVKLLIWMKDHITYDYKFLQNM